MRDVDRRRKILPIKGAVMLRFMDWSVVGLGCLLALASLAGQRWGRTRAGRKEALEQRTPAPWAWLPLLVGLGMIGTKVPGMLHAPRSVVEAVDALDFLLAATVSVLVLRTLRRPSPKPSR
ncbi:hypothetical protein AB0L75_34910 [Streptomyces sp. NPDC052101]|uniref:hypothetical protein n=1 Tax=Streptomyces sp. NPDC052101 TaxID=3155763 RepID=UPI0034466EE6